MPANHPTPESSKGPAVGANLTAKSRCCGASLAWDDGDVLVPAAWYCTKCGETWLAPGRLPGDDEQ